jgi:hypothetical protein
MVEMSMMRWTLEQCCISEELACACVYCVRVHAVWCTLGRPVRRTQVLVLQLYYSYSTIPWYASVCTHCSTQIRIMICDRDASDACLLMVMSHDSMTHALDMWSWACSCSCSSAVLARADTKFRNLVARLLRGSDTAVLYLDLPSQGLSIRRL